MRIAQVSPLIESVPPKGYGGTERIVSYLTENLVGMGHEVTLFASGDSVTEAKLEAVYPKALRFDDNAVDYLAHHLVMFERLIKKSAEFDIIHFHTGYSHFPICQRLAIPHLTTHHGRLDLPELFPLYREFDKLPLISISNSQRQPIPWANWLATIYNGIPQNLFTFYPQRGKYLVFLGRISPEKRVDRAITIAQQTGMEIKIAAKVDKVDIEYFNTIIKPLLKDPRVEYINEISDHEKNDLLGNAYCLLFPIDWPEPFGLVMIEAMACGTPVIGFELGAVPEVISSGVTGFIVNSLKEASQAVEQVETLDRQLCRQAFEEQFTASYMSEKYCEVYHRLLK